MSHEATTWAFGQRGLKPATKMVLLALANCHNPHHGCFPSKKRLAEDCEMSERSVADHLQKLEQGGLISVEKRGGKRMGQFASNRYILGFERENCQGQDLPSAKSAVDRRQNLPSNLVKESCKRTSKGEHPRDVLLQFADGEAVTSFIAYRQRRNKPLTLTAAKRQATHLGKIADAGGDPSDALGMAEEKGWVAVEADWYFNARRQMPTASSNSDDHLSKMQLKYGNGGQ